MLEGLKFKLKDNMTAPGFHAKQFPFGHNEETWPQLILDLTNTRFVQQHELEQRLNLQCRAWANNIDQESRESYKGTTRGGVDKKVSLEEFQELEMVIFEKIIEKMLIAPEEEKPKMFDDDDFFEYDKHKGWGKIWHAFKEDVYTPTKAATIDKITKKFDEKINEVSDKYVGNTASSFLDPFDFGYGEDVKTSARKSVRFIVITALQIFGVIFACIFCYCCGGNCLKCCFKLCSKCCARKKSSNDTDLAKYLQKLEMEESLNRLEPDRLEANRLEDLLMTKRLQDLPKAAKNPKDEETSKDPKYAEATKNPKDVETFKEPKDAEATINTKMKKLLKIQNMQKL